jgi:hypothetical protein
MTYEPNNQKNIFWPKSRFQPKTDLMLYGIILKEIKPMQMITEIEHEGLVKMNPINGTL